MRLTPNQLRVVHMYYGFAGYEPRTMRQIAAAEGLARERIRPNSQQGVGGTSRLSITESVPIAVTASHTAYSAAPG